MPSSKNTVASQFLKTRIIVLSIAGLCSYLLQDWTEDYPGMAELIARFVLYTFLFFAILADEMKGTLKTSNVYRASFHQTTQLPFVQGLIAVYLTILVFLSLYIAWSDDAIEISPDHTWRLFLIVAPLFLVVFAGKYIIEREQNS